MTHETGVKLRTSCMTTSTMLGHITNTTFSAVGRVEDRHYCAHVLWLPRPSEENFVQSAALREREQSIKSDFVPESKF